MSSDIVAEGVTRIPWTRALGETPAYNAAASERHWHEVDSPFQNSLKQ
jgi:hypothetical protein